MMNFPLTLTHILERTARVDGPVCLDSQALHQRLAPRASHRDGPDAYARFVRVSRLIAKEEAKGKT